MIRPLVIDALRRIPFWPTWFFLAMFAIAWMVFGFSGTPSYGIALSLGLAFGIGPFWLPSRGEMPVIPYLPVSRRDIWRANWIMSTVVAVAAVTLLELPGALASTAFDGGLGLSSLALTVVLNFLYAGSGCAIVAATGLAGTRLRMTGPLGGLVFWTTFILFIGGVGWGFAVHRMLPTRWADVTVVHVTVMTLGAVLTFASYFHQPSFGARPVKLRATRPKPSATAVSQRALSGSPRLIAHELVWAAGMWAVMAVTLSIVGIVFEGFSGSSQSLVESLASQGPLIFAPAVAPPVADGPEFLTRFWWYALFIACVSARFPEMIRHLRALPLGSAALEAILIGWPMLIWTLVWVLLAGIHLALNGPHSITTIRLPLLLALIGLSALVQSLGLRFEKWKTYASGAAVALPFTRLTTSQSPWFLLLLAVLTTAIAVVLNRVSLRRADTYRRTVPFGMKAQSAR